MPGSNDRNAKTATSKSNGNNANVDSRLLAQKKLKRKWFRGEKEIQYSYLLPPSDATIFHETFVVDLERFHYYNRSGQRLHSKSKSEEFSAAVSGGQAKSSNKEDVPEWSLSETSREAISEADIFYNALAEFFQDVILNAEDSALTTCHTLDRETWKAFAHIFHQGCLLCPALTNIIAHCSIENPNVTLMERDRSYTFFIDANGKLIINCYARLGDIKPKEAYGDNSQLFKGLDGKLYSHDVLLKSNKSFYVIEQISVHKNSITSTAYHNLPNYLVPKNKKFFRDFGKLIEEQLIEERRSLDANNPLLSDENTGDENIEKVSIDSNINYITYRQWMLKMLNPKFWIKHFSKLTLAAIFVGTCAGTGLGPLLAVAGAFSMATFGLLPVLLVGAAVGLLASVFTAATVFYFKVRKSAKVMPPHSASDDLGKAEERVDDERVHNTNADTLRRLNQPNNSDEASAGSTPSLPTLDGMTSSGSETGADSSSAVSEEVAEGQVHTLAPRPRTSSAADTVESAGEAALQGAGEVHEDALHAEHHLDGRNTAGRLNRGESGAPHAEDKLLREADSDIDSLDSSYADGSSDSKNGTADPQREHVTLGH